MKTQIETDVCFYCGASKGIHQYETMKCPLHGIEETRFDKLSGKFYPQKWEETTFKDSGIENIETESIAIFNQTNLTPRQLLEQRNELLRALQRFIKFADNLKLEYESSMIREAKETIKKATE